MPLSTDGTPRSGHDQATIRIAAAGDVHASGANRDQMARSFAELEDAVDLVLLAGDLTTHGEPEQAAVLAEACRSLSAPVVAVLGNHDWHSNRTDELVAVLREGGVRVLEREHVVLSVGSVEVGVVGVKGFVGGFPGSHLPDFGEPLLRSVYAEASGEVEALERGLHAIETCAVRIVLLHYSPTLETLTGERPEIAPFLGTDRLAGPITEHGPDVVLHGHAHSGAFRGRIAEVPVFNVSVPVLGTDFWRFELTADRRPREPLH
jgi:Icc-related predicted phosphoesterase